MELSEQEVLKLSEKELAERIERLDAEVYETVGGKKSLRTGFSSKSLLMLSKLRQRLSKVESDRRKGEVGAAIDAEYERRAKEAERMRRIKLSMGAGKFW